MLKLEDKKWKLFIGSNKENIDVLGILFSVKLGDGRRDCIRLIIDFCLRM